jgi:hypothetical protein
VCSALRSVNRLVNGTGSLAIFRGINATGASGFGVTFATTVVAGGDIVRVADCGSVSVALLTTLDAGRIAVALAWPASLFATAGLSLGMIDPTKTDFGAILVGTMGATGSFVPSLSFSLFTSGSRAGSAMFAVGGERMASGLGALWLKMQFGSSHLAADGHGTLPKLLKAGTEGHMILMAVKAYLLVSYSTL